MFEIATRLLSSEFITDNEQNLALVIIFSICFFRLCESKLRQRRGFDHARLTNLREFGQGFYFAQALQTNEMSALLARKHNQPRAA